MFNRYMSEILAATPPTRAQLAARTRYLREAERDGFKISQEDLDRVAAELEGLE